MTDPKTAAHALRDSGALETVCETADALRRQRERGEGG